MPVPFIGGSYLLHTRKADVQRAVNLYPVANELPGGKTGSYLAQVPGLDTFSPPFQDIDPFADDVILLSQPQTGDTSFIDYSPLHNTILNANSIAVLDPVRQLFGLPTVRVPAAAGPSTSGGLKIDYPISVPLNIGAGPFTIELFIYTPSPEVNPDGFWEMALENAVQGHFAFLIGSNAASPPTVGAWYNFVSAWGLQQGSIGPSVANTWNYYAMTRTGNTFRAFHGVLGGNATLQQTGTMSGSIEPSTGWQPGAQLSFSSNSGFPYEYWMVVRITKACRYTASFPVPSERWPIAP